NHIHHLLTNNGWSHSLAAKLICFVHAIVLVLGYFLKDVPQLAGICILFFFLLLIIFIFQRIRMPESLKQNAISTLEN
ncbi:MAG: hypothetical protein ACJ748_03820, partial [Flavisolibacter sp.]